MYDNNNSNQNKIIRIVRIRIRLDDTIKDYKRRCNEHLEECQTQDWPTSLEIYAYRCVG